MFEVAATEIAREVDSTLLFFLIFSLVLLVGIVATMIAFAVKYRRSANPQVTQIEGNLKLEIAWTIVPTILVIGLFFVGYKGFAMMRDAPAGAMEVHVMAQQWFWTFTYKDSGVTTTELTVPVDTPVKLNITAPASDVLHSFYVPAFRIKEDAVPGMNTWLWFEADRLGTYNVFCAEFCGKDHSRMISERQRIAEQFRSEGAGESARINGQKERELKEITSEAYRQAQEIKGRADAEAADIYAAAYNRDSEFYRFLKTMDILKETLDEGTVMVLSTDGDFLRYLNKAK